MPTYNISSIYKGVEFLPINTILQIIIKYNHFKSMN